MQAARIIVHAAGCWSAAQVRVRRVAGSRPHIPEVERMIERAWRSAVARPGVHLFDGPMCRHESWRLDDDGRVLHMDLSTTSYKVFLGTNLSHPELAEQFGRNALANPVGVSPALLSCDGYLLFGVRNGRVAYYPHRIHPFAGAVDPDGDADLFAAVRRELGEELDLDETDIADIHCTGIAEDVQLRQPEVIFHVRSKLSRDQIEQRLDREEHGESFSIRADRCEVESALRDERLTPVAVAALALWGRLEFGTRWYDGPCRAALEAHG